MKDFLLDPDLLNEVRQEYETLLTLLEHEFLGAMITSDWTEFDQFVNDFRAGISTKDLSRPGADSFSQTELTERQETTSSCHQVLITSQTTSTELSDGTQVKRASSLIQSGELPAILTCSTTSTQTAP